MRAEAARGIIGDGWADGWNPHSFLRCITCGAITHERQAFDGCENCTQDGVNGPVEVAYTKPVISGERAAVLSWVASEWQPIGAECRVDWDGQR